MLGIIGVVVLLTGVFALLCLVLKEWSERRKNK